MLTNFDFDEWLDMPAHRGQRVERYTFAWINGVTNEPLGMITPDRGSAPTISHDTASGIKRRLSLQLGVTDTSGINPITDRILPYLTIGGTTYPLGRYMFSTETDAISTGGDRGQFTLLDEGFIIDQQLERGYSSTSDVRSAVLGLLNGLPLLGTDIESTSFSASGSFGVGQTRGQALDAYATQGDYFPYWMGNDGLFHMIRTVDPAAVIPDFDWDAGFKVVRDTVSRTSDVLDAPNRFIVMSNANDAATAPIVGTYDVPASAPHSIINRGFVIPDTRDAQLATQLQATAAARNIGLRATVYERVTLNTSIDPRHDSYNVIHWAGANWLELSWSMTLSPGAPMQHTMRKAYA
jgi:hypothetical protein